MSHGHLAHGARMHAGHAGPPPGNARKQLSIALGLFVLVVLASAAIGPHLLAPHDFLDAVTGRDARLHTLFVQLRLPRVAGALLLGALLGLSGALLQRATRNQLADPNLLGLHAGPHLAMMILLLHAPPLMVARLRIPVTFAGAALAAGLVWILARKQGRVAPRRLLLVGIAVAGLLHAASLALTFSAPLEILQRSLTWANGNLASISWSDDKLLAIALAVLLPAGLLLSRRLDALGLGDEAAASLGVHVERTRLEVALLSALAAGICVATAGGIAFVGLLAPNLARRLTGPRSARLLTIATLTGAIVVGVADTIARTAMHNTELPTGTLVAAAGAPYFLFLLLRS